MFNLDSQIKEIARQLADYVKTVNEKDDYWDTAIKLRRTVKTAVENTGLPEPLHTPIMFVLLRRLEITGDIPTQMTFANALMASGLIEELAKSTKIIYDKLQKEDFSLNGDDAYEQIATEIGAILNLFKGG